MDKRARSSRLSLGLGIWLLLVFVLAACGGSSDEDGSTPGPTPIPTLASLITLPTSVSKDVPAPTDLPDLTDTPAPAEETSDEEVIAPRVYIQSPSNNAIIPVTSTVVMGFEGLDVLPAGELIDGSGHFHILVDTDFIEPGAVIPKDEQHLHFGDGSVETELTLTPGSHTVRLQFADGAHIALDGDQYRDEIVVSVKDGAAEQAVRFATPRDGATVPAEFDVVMAATGLIVEPAGDIHARAGHFHILIDTDFIEPGDVIPKDDQHLHFGSGQQQTSLALEPGEHILRLQLADGVHIALDGDQYRDEISVIVADDAVANQVHFVTPLDGETVSRTDSETVAVQMTAAGLFVESSGAVLRTEGGHMHILVDTDFIAAGEVIPKDDQHIHFGGGQLIAELALEPGEHVLRLQMANGAHIAVDGEQYRDEISIIVDGEAGSTEDAATEEESDKDEPDDGASSENSDENSDDESATDAADPVRSPDELWVAMACSGCHELDLDQTEADRGPVGPHQGNLYERAVALVGVEGVADYVYESIVDPNANVLDGYLEKIMPQDYAEKMSEEELQSLVAWLLERE